MNQFDENVRDSDLALSDAERRSGIVKLKAITWKRMTIIVAEADDGVIAVGTNVSWPGTRHNSSTAISIARDHAINRLAELRERRPVRQSRGVPA